MPTNVRDPRTIITPDAFEVDTALLGIPLAPPWRRFWAMAIDFAVVGLLTAVLSSVQLLLWGGIALLLLRLALGKGGRSMGQAAGILLRVAVGCLGVTILGIVLLVFALIRLSPGDDVVERTMGAGFERAMSGAIERSVRQGALEVLADAGSADEALDDLEELAGDLLEIPLSPEARRSLMLGSVPSDAPWAAQADSLVDLALARAEEQAGAEQAAVPGTADDTTEEADADQAAESGAAADAAEAAESGEPSPEVLELREQLEAEREARRELVAELEESRSGLAAFAEVLRDVWEQLGSAIGLWSIYFTLLLTLWGGQTVGKRLMGVRVLRLDGASIGWWPAFERAGGYVAGLATGLLGFAQVFWDPNRQCIHDKIVGTVVVDERAERVPGAWQEAWSSPEPSPRPTEE